MELSTLINIKCKQKLAFQYLLPEKFPCSGMLSKKEFAIVSKQDKCHAAEFQIRGGVHIIFYLFLHENICCWYSSEAPHESLGKALLMSVVNI